jgi:hypothetical protein
MPPCIKKNILLSHSKKQVCPNINNLFKQQMRLLTIILIFIILYYLLSKYFFPYLLKKIIKKAQARYREKQGETRAEGDVNVDYVPPEASRSKFNPDSVEDVDYEEIKDNNSSEK